MHNIAFQLAYRGPVEGYIERTVTHAWSGDVPGFGPIELQFPIKRIDRQNNLLLTSAWGERFPSVVLAGGGFRNHVEMHMLELTVNEWPAVFKRRRLALTRRGRALRINVCGRDYRYQVSGGKRQHALLRDGAGVSTTRSQWRHPRTVTGVARGDVDNVDIALAVVLQSLYTRNLTFGGALYSFPGRFMNRADLPDF
ncbi:hypothetical protein [Streptomyces sp. NPDC051183]|uniref:hypothetical protein n=1 Tax=unclassified Streptomyces TaxID=2593676 RepID=UPI0034174F7C